MVRSIWAALSALLSLPSPRFCLRRAAVPPVPQIEATVLWDRLAAGEQLLLVDVRAAAEYEAGHIPGARLLPLGVLPQRSHELPRQRPLVLVCRNGVRSQVACEHLARLGYVRLFNLHGGMRAWTGAGLPYHL